MISPRTRRRLSRGCSSSAASNIPRITESSGIAVSRKDAGVFWTHNDGGGRRQVLYAMTRHGKPLAEFRVTGAVLDDWEDIAADDKGHLFIGDVGNNDAKRTSISVHEIDEPDTKKIQASLVRVTRSWNLRYPAAPFDCESLFIWGEHGYLISKVFKDERADIYRFSLTNTAPFQTLESVGEIKIDSPVTGADISQDGNLLGIVAKNGAYVYGIQRRRGARRQRQAAPEQIQTRPHRRLHVCARKACSPRPSRKEIFLFVDEAFRTGPQEEEVPNDAGRHDARRPPTPTSPVRHCLGHVILRPAHTWL